MPTGVSQPPVALPVADSTAVVKGSADPTKLLRFEVDGFTAGATRVITPPNSNGTMVILEGSSAFTGRVDSVLSSPGYAFRGLNSSHVTGLYVDGAISYFGTESAASLVLMTSNTNRLKILLGGRILGNAAGTLVTDDGVRDFQAGSIHSSISDNTSYSTTAQSTNASAFDGLYVDNTNSGANLSSILFCVRDSGVALARFGLLYTGVGTGDFVWQSRSGGNCPEVMRLSNVGALTVAGSVTIGGGTAIAKVLSAPATLNFGSIAAGATEELDISVTGTAVGDDVNVTVPSASITADIKYEWWPVTDAVRVRATNTHASAARDPASGSFRAKVVKF